MPDIDAQFVISDAFLASPLAHIYWNLRNERYTHSVALWAAWRAYPDSETRKKVGLPATQKALADRLGVSARTLRKYPHKYPEVLSSAQAALADSILGEYVGPALTALGETAATSGREGYADRRLLLEITGIYTPKSKQDITSGGEPVQPIQFIREDRGPDHDDGDTHPDTAAD